MPKALLMVYTNCDAEREQEFNHWYDTVHLPDLLSLDGISGAQRFKLAGPGPQTVNPAGEPAVAQYLAVYELDTDDVDAIQQRIRAASPQWRERGRLFDGIKLVSMATYRALGERQTAAAPAPATATA